MRTSMLAGVVLGATVGALAAATAAQGATAPGGPVWSQVKVGASPTWGVSTALAYDSATHQALMFGGEPVVGQLGDFATDETRLWSAATSSWQLLSPAVRPSARESASLAFDTATSQMVLFGGYDPGNGVELQDTWLWDGHTWTAASTTSQPPAASTLVFDPATSQLLAFGAGVPWRWTGTDWVQLSAPALPGQLLAAAFAPATRQLVAVVRSGTSLQTWVWTGASWLQLLPATALPTDSSGSMSMVLDQGLNQLVLVTDVLPSGTVQTLLWNGTDWQQVPPPAPSPAMQVHLVFNGAQGQLLLFEVLSGDVGPPNLTWVLNVPTTTTVSASPGSPTLGAAVTLSATVGAGRLLAAVGKVEFADNGTPIPGCLARGMSKGIATCLTALAPAGRHTLTATYLGAAGYQPSTASLQVSVH